MILDIINIYEEPPQKYTVSSTKIKECKNKIHPRKISDPTNNNSNSKEFIDNTNNINNINNITLEESEHMVNEFVENMGKETEHNEQNSKVQEDRKFKLKGSYNNKLSIHNYPHSKKTIKCKKLSPTLLNGKEISIKIKNPTESVEGGVFTNSFTFYELYTEPFGWKVKRRYSDFDKLRKLLEKFFPNFYLPPLPKKQIGNKRFETAFIEKRMKKLELFINKIAKNESFKSSEVLLAFLSYDNRDKFQEKIHEYMTTIPCNYIEEYSSLSGNLALSFDDSNYQMNIKKYIFLQDVIFTRLNNGLKFFRSNMSSAIENLKEIEKCFKMLEAVNRSVLSNHTVIKSFEEWSCFFGNWRKALIKQDYLVKTRVKDFFKYINLEGKAYNELLKKRDDIKNKYDDESSKLFVKKQEIFQSGDISKFELNPNDSSLDKKRLITDRSYAYEHICYKDSKMVERIYNHLGYANYMNKVELDSMIQEYRERYVENIKKFNEEFYPSINDLINSWTNMQTFAMSAN